MTAYLSVVAMDEISGEVLRRMVLALPRPALSKVVSLLRFVWREEVLSGWALDKWVTVYDRAYVTARVLEPALQNKGTVQSLLLAAEERLSGVTAEKRRTATRRAVTEVQPFNLTRPRPRAIPVPQRVAAPPKVYKIPKSTYRTPIERDALERKREQNRARAQQQLAEAAAHRTAGLAERRVPERTQRLRRELEEREQAELRMRPVAKPPPATTRSGGGKVVKLTAGSILREEKLFRDKLQREEQRLAAVEAGAFDVNEYLEWELRIKAQDERERLEAIEIKHLQGLIGKEEALLATQRHAEHRREAAVGIKVESRALMERFLAEREAEGKMNRRTVEETSKLYERVLEAKRRNARQNARQAAAVQEENRRLLAETARRDAADKARRDDVIRQIRALESTPVDRTKVVDLTTTAGVYMSEMSYIELQERLAMLKARAHREEEAKRSVIASTKRAEREALLTKVDTIARARAEVQAQPTVRQRFETTLLSTQGTGTGKIAALRSRLAESRLQGNTVRAKQRVAVGALKN